MEKIIDYITGIEVSYKPEEEQAVQPFAKALVEDYGYPKDCIMTHPQFRVKARPSDTKKEYPVDIAVFKDSTKNDDDVYIIVECKKKIRKDGRTQLEDYLRFCRAKLGVWFNGEERLFLRKYEKNGQILFEEIPNIPMYGQRVEDIGKFKRGELQSTHNLKQTFRAIRNYLAANTVGATRDEVLAQQLINVIFCKIYDERFTEPDSIVSFRSGVDENPNDVKARILKLFEKVKRKYREVIDTSDEITLDANSIVYIVGELQNYCLTEADRDVIADAFETFIDHALKGGQGQFFTPRNVIKMMIDILNPTEDDFIIDPSCGSGGFLVETLRYIWAKLDNQGNLLHWTDRELQEEKMEVALNKICGIDKDYFLSKVSKAYMAILGDGKGGLFCEDSLERPENWNPKTGIKINLNKFSILLTNPPFGSKIKVQGEEKLKQYDLGHKWTRNKTTNMWEKGNIKSDETPQVLFIERDYQLLANYGKMGIVLPDGFFGNEGFSYVRNWLKERGRILAIIDIPTETFQPNTATKTSVLFYQKMPKSEIPENYDIFMAICDTCGHDRRGNEIASDDIQLVAEQYHKWAKEQGLEN
jgi:type I restriction enzyme M protein